MKQSTADQIVAAANQLGFDFEAYPDYSGRGMYGRTTVGITVSGPNELGAFAAAVGQAVRDSSDPDELIDDVMRVATDSLGRQTIVY